MDRKVKIKGKDNLVRDLSTNAIINTNVDALNKAKLIKQNKLNDKKRLDVLEDKMDRILKLLEEKIK